MHGATMRIEVSSLLKCDAVPLVENYITFRRIVFDPATQHQIPQYLKLQKSLFEDLKPCRLNFG